MFIYKTKLSNEVFLKNSDNPTVRNYLDEIEKACEKFRNTPIASLKFSKLRLYDETGERAEFQKGYFERRRRLTMFFLRVWLYKNADDIKELEDILWAVCDEFSWAIPAHLSGILTDFDISPERIDLFSAETAHTIAETLSLCGDLIHPLVAKRCIDEITRRIFEPFESENRNKYALSWEDAKTNWSAVCGGAVGMTALYLIADKERLDKIITRTKSACNSFFESCTSDGVCKEGISYWMYAMQYYVAFDELLKERLGESLVSDTEKLKSIAAFPSVACMANNIPVKFSDCGDTHLFFGIFCKLNEICNVPIPDKSYYTGLTDRCSRTAGTVRTIAWFNPELLKNESSKNDVFLKEGQWASLHFDDMTAVIKGGSNDEPHNHNDIGSYMFVKGENEIAAELGAAKYTKAYFEHDKRYAFLNAGSHGHSLPIVNGCVQSKGSEYASDRFEKTKDGILISFKDAYDKKSNLTSLVRTMSLGGSGFAISDSFEFSSTSNTVCERIITKFDASVVDGNNVVISDGDNILATVSFLNDGKINIFRESYTIPNSSGKTDEYSSEDKMQYATIIEFECATHSNTIKIAYIIK